MLSFFYKIKNAYIYKTSSFRKNKLISTDFSIISNNCWGGWFINHITCHIYLPPLAVSLWHMTI